MPAECKIKAEKSFIGGWFIDDLNLCDCLIDFFENNNDKYSGMVTNDNGLVIDNAVKKSVDLNLKPEIPIVREYAEQLQLVVNEYVKAYPFANETALWIIESANIQKYNPGGAFYKWHTERNTAKIPEAFRHLVFMTYLNDVTDAGETEFFHQQLKVRPQKGLTLIWPADWTHTHRGIPSMTETKYIVTGWFMFVKEFAPKILDC